MKQKNFLKIVLIMLLSLFASFFTKAQTLAIGDIAIIAYNADGDDDFAFVALKDIPASEIIYFTDNEWNGTAFTDLNEGELTWTNAGSILSAGSVVVFTDVSAVSSSVSIGTLSGSGFNLGASNEWFYALTSAPATSYGSPPVFLSAFANDAGMDWLSNTGLIEGTSAVDFDDDNDGYQFTGSRSGEASFSNYLSIIYDKVNWAIETSNGENILPINTTSFTTGAVPPGLTLGAVSNNTNENGTTATFTVVLNAQPTTNVILNISSGDTDEVTILPATLTFTNSNWDTPQTITATGVNDAIIDGNIDVTITVAVDDASSDDAYDGLSKTTTVTNEDDDIPNIVITEIMYNSPSANVDDEWIEIYNADGTSIDISNWSVERTTSIVTFPASTIIDSGEYLLIAFGSNATPPYNNDFPFVPDFNLMGVDNNLVAINTTSNKLTNSSTTILLKNSFSSIVDTVTYDDGDTDGNHDGLGKSLEIIDVNTDNSSTSTNWRSSSNNGGSPGASITSTWTGGTSTVWNLAGNWDNGIPTSSMNAYIPATATRPTISSSAIANKILLVSGASLITKDATSITSKLTYLRNIDFVSGGNNKGWYLLSSPITGQDFNDDYATINDLATSGTKRGLATYTTGSDSWSYLIDDDSNASSFISGKGYSMKKESTSGSISFTGTINTNDTGVDFNLSTDGNRFNALGNPYTSFINSATFLNNETAISETKTLWVWNQTLSTNGAYEVKDISDALIIAPGQGFFVKANTTGGTFNFVESNQSNSNTDTFQKADSNTVIKLWITDGSIKNYSRIKYIDKATTGFDAGYDGEIFGGNSNSFAIYSHLIDNNKGKNYQLQSLPNSDYENMIIPIGVIATSGKEITFTINAQNLPEGINVYLEDRQKNTFTRLDEPDSNYKVTFNDDVNGTGRFYIHTKASKALSIDNYAILNSLNIFKSDATTLRIVGLPQGKTSISLFNILGKQIIHTTFDTNGVKDISLQKLATGVYFAEVQTETGKVSKKIILE